MFRIRELFVVLLALGLFTFLRGQGDPDPARFSQEIESFKNWDSKNSYPDSAVLFAGSSSIRMWPTHDFFPEFKVINRGFGGAHISDMLHFFEETVARYKPAIIVFYCGDNDIAAGKSPQRVLNDFQTFVEKAHALKPGLPLIYIPIKPSLARWKLWPAMQQTNRLIENYCLDNPSLYYANIADPMMGKDSRPSAELFREDGLHLNNEGYILWSKIVRPFISKAAGAGPATADTP